jgi:hypothetical protein
MRLPALALTLILTVILASCALAPGAGPTNKPAATQQPEPSDPTSPPATESPMPTQARSATPPESEEPPDGALGQDDVADVGWRGSYCWQGTCADTTSPVKAMLPTIAVQSGSLLVFSLEDGEFVSWNAMYGPDGGSLEVLAQGGRDFDPDAPSAAPSPLGFVEFNPPPKGDWVVAVQVFFEDGDAQYAWHVTVE